MTDLVTIQMVAEEDKHLMALFASTGVPNDVEFTLERDETTKQKKMKAKDLNSDLEFIGDDSVHKNSDYYLGIRNNNVLEVHPISIYKMDPIIEVNQRIQNLTQTPLTIKEQMEEMKEKFGSRKTQRSLASKRKYAIEFGEDDVQHIETQTKEVLDSSVSQSANESTISDSIDILPKQNRDSICVEEVYDINDIILENESNVLKPLEKELFVSMDNSFVKSLISNSNDCEQKLIAIYINLIILLLNLKTTDLRKADPLPTLNSEIKEFLFTRYLTIQSLGNKIRYYLSDKQKDRLLIYAIILSLRLHNFRPIDMEVLQKSLKVPLRPLRRLVEIIGCFVESIKTSSGVNTKFAVFRIPLNTIQMKESKKSSYRRR